ncbi:asparagine synthetase B family protein [Rugamonas aquatica]|uniref:asparagine synthase (glutamine-hydrolyzing) n=1 Tax=Rugamonas aquatica TaxID=2743357 RepID=A0A6A7MVB3_9BURK|nr:asparagine synthase C-terminal domain-containing protein [Rugamonas aquatica]MQA36961.1 asparagine synthase [Rugamonas aquatica]
MSGLCGYLDTAEGTAVQHLLAGMAAPLVRFDDSPIRIAAAQRGGIAVAAAAGSASVHGSGGVLVAVWGRPLLNGCAENLAERFAALWQIHGAKACAALSGPFAVCAMAEPGGQLLLAIDRSGVHTMHYQQLTQGVLFGSSAAALQAHPMALKTLDPQSIYNYLYFHTVPGPRTVFRGQRRLQPGEFVQYRHGHLETGQYWKMEYQEESNMSFGELKRQFLSTLEGSVRRSSGGARTGAFLSGGTDSSTLAGMLASVSGTAPRTYSIGFDVAGYDEMRYARIAARHFGADHHELYVTAGDVASAIPRIAAASDQPFGNSSAVPAYYCANMARADGVTRLLGGDGGDELFGGNERYAHQAVLSRYEQLPSALRQVALEPLLFGLAGKLDLTMLRKARSYVEQALVPMPARLETYNLLQRYGPAEVLHADFLAGVDESAPIGQLSDCYWQEKGLSQINRMQTLDLRYTLADNDLRKVSLACELGGVEVAFPFLCDEMLAFSARLSPKDKLNGTRLRYFFKRALRGYLPPAILRKKKHGFGLPFGHWLQHDAALQGLVLDSLSDLKKRQIIRADFIERLMRTLIAEHPAYHGTMVWVLMMLEQWLARSDAPIRK